MIAYGRGRLAVSQIPTLIRIMYDLRPTMLTARISNVKRRVYVET